MITLPLPDPPSRTHGGLLHAVQSLLYLIVAAVFIVGFVAQPFQIPSASMDPTLRVGDFLLVDKQLVPSRGILAPTPIRRGDIVVFHFPVDSTLHLVKRVIGLPGDRLRLHGNRVFLNGQSLDEPYAVYRPAPLDTFRDNFPSMHSAEPGIQSRWWIEMRGRIDQGELVIPSGRYFVLGDNRNDSEDSRYWGFVPAAAIVGKPFLVYFSVRSRDPAIPALTPPSLEDRLLTRIANFARWDRTLTLIH